MTTIEGIQNKITPRQLFFIDSLGAILSAILLGLVLASFNEFFGVSRRVLHILALLAVILAIYSSSCYAFVKDNWRPYLRVIGIANLLYCLLTAGMIIYLHNSLTVWGLVYFVGEIVIIVILATIELKYASSGDA